MEDYDAEIINSIQKKLSKILDINISLNSVAKLSRKIINSPKKRKKKKKKKILKFSYAVPNICQIKNQTQNNKKRKIHRKYT